MERKREGKSGEILEARKSNRENSEATELRETRSDILEGKEVKDIVRQRSSP